MNMYIQNIDTECNRKQRDDVCPVCFFHTACPFPDSCGEGSDYYILAKNTEQQLQPENGPKCPVTACPNNDCGNCDTEDACLVKAVSG